jgi:hypothetical protein
MGGLMLKDLLKLIPAEEVYKDAAQPAFRQIGESLGKVVKATRFILAPLEYLAAHHDRWERYLEKISNNVKEENMIEGHPQVVVPALEGLCYTQEDSIISELFINLLSHAIDKTKLDLAHPAFPKIIQQLSPDEAVVLFFLKKRPYKLREQADFDHSKHLFFNKRIVSEEFPVLKLMYSQHIWLYMDHLHSLNLAGTWQAENQETIVDDQTKDQVGVYINSERRLTQFGHLFSKACVPDSYQDL